MDAENSPTAPDGFHYRGQVPSVKEAIDKNGKVSFVVSRVARYIPEETKKTNKEKYEDLFYFIRDDSFSKPICICTCCGKEVTATYSRGAGRALDISNLMKHWKSVHVSELTPKDQGVETKAHASSPFDLAKRISERAPKRLPSEIKSVVCGSLAEMILSKGSFPLSMVDDFCFRRGVKAIVKLFTEEEVNFPSRNGVRKRMMNLMERASTNDLNTFKSALVNRRRKFFAITNDCTTAINKVPYAVLTASLITMSPAPGSPWVLHELYLDCSPNEGGRHTAVHNTNQMKGALRRFLGLQEEAEVSSWISVATFDCASNSPAGALNQEGE